jgi:hypothetical protein
MTPPRPPRWFVADDILGGRVNLDLYPFRYIYVTAAPGEAIGSVFSGRAGFAAMIDRVLTAVEMLEARGWDVVNFEQDGRIAYLRRVAR